MPLKGCIRINETFHRIFKLCVPQSMFIYKTLILILFLSHEGICDTEPNSNIDLPSFLQTVTNLRNKLIGLLGNVPLKSGPKSGPDVDDLVEDSVFEKQRNEKETLFDNMKSMSADLGGKEINLDVLPEVHEENPEFCSKIYSMLMS